MNKGDSGDPENKRKMWTQTHTSHFYHPLQGLGNIVAENL